MRAKIILVNLMFPSMEGVSSFFVKEKTMRRLGRHVVQLYPKDENELYPFLFRVTQEWQFLTNALSLEIPDVTRADVAAITGARDLAIELFNEWMDEEAGRQWFRVLQRYEVLDGTWVKEKMIMYAAGAQILVPHQCELVLAHIDNIDVTIFDSGGNEILIRRSEAIQLHCIIAQHYDLKVLPLEAVPSVSILNH